MLIYFCICWLIIFLFQNQKKKDLFLESDHLKYDDEESTARLLSKDNSNLYNCDSLKSSHENLQLNSTENDEMNYEMNNNYDEENKPFLLALWQSSLPDDIMTDIK